MTIIDKMSPKKHSHPSEEILGKLREFIEELDFKNEEVAKEANLKMCDFYSFLTSCKASKSFKDEASLTLSAIIQKQYDITKAYKKQERVHTGFLYTFESVVFIAILVFFYHAVISFHGIKFAFCVGASVVSMGALLFFHVREYDRTERLLRRIFPRKDDEEAEQQE